MTLVTSASPTSSDRVAGSRSCMVIQSPCLSGRRRSPARTQRGTSGDASGLLLAIIWSALLAATIAVAVRLHAIWPRAAAHLVTTPVMLLLLWLIFQSLDLLLPGTM